MESSMCEQLLTDHVYVKVLREGGRPHSIIRVKNISTQALVGGSIWGVTSNDIHRNVFQPVLISSVLSLREPFRSAVQSDTVNNSTVNYSTLSKEILKAVAICGRDTSTPKKSQSLEDFSLFDLVIYIHFWVTKTTPWGQDSIARFSREKSDGASQMPFLDIDKLFELGITLFLPKATLLSSGVSLSTSSMYFPGRKFRSALKIHNIRIPTLIGVNQKERLARQLIVVNVKVNPYICGGQDYYNELEQLIVKTTEESSFGTLEALATHLNSRIVKYFIYAYLRTPQMSLSAEEYPTCFSDVEICLEKPSAVTFADAPSIEILRSSNPREDKDAERLWEECIGLAKANDLRPLQIPYPLQSTLTAWISENSLEDST